jgi:NAD(P)H-dependent FMN reductase
LRSKDDAVLIATPEYNALKTIGASVLGAELRVPAAHSAFGEGGRPRDPERAAALRAIVRELLDQTERRAA